GGGGGAHPGAGRWRVLPGLGACAAGMRIDDHLVRNDACGFFAGLDDLLVTGPTHANVNDFRVLLIL
ncbi:MAG: MOFRL family protein, partial [Betaproteobacteria bacterium]